MSGTDTLAVEGERHFVPNVKAPSAIVTTLPDDVRSTIANAMRLPHYASES